MTALIKTQNFLFALGLLSGLLGLAAKSNLVSSANGPFVDLSYFISHIWQADGNAIAYWVLIGTFMMCATLCAVGEYGKKHRIEP